MCMALYYLDNLRSPKARRIMKRRRPKAAIDVGAAFAEEVDHLLGAEGGGPVQQGLANVVHIVHLNV